MLVCCVYLSECDSLTPTTESENPPECNNQNKELYFGGIPRKARKAEREREAGKGIRSVYYCL